MQLKITLRMALAHSMLYIYHKVQWQPLQTGKTYAVKGNAQFMFLCHPQKSLVNVCLKKILKCTVTKKVIVCFNNLGEKNF